MCVCVVCLYLCVCVRNETTAPPSLGCSKIYAAFQARSLSQENLNRIVIWNFLKHLKKEISCLSVSSDYRYFLEHTPRGKQGREVRSGKFWFVRAVKPGPLELETILAVPAEVGPGWVRLAWEFSLRAP